MLDRRRDSSVEISRADRSISRPGKVKSGRKDGSSRSTSWSGLWKRSATLTFFFRLKLPCFPSIWIEFRCLDCGDECSHITLGYLRVGQYVATLLIKDTGHAISGWRNQPWTNSTMPSLEYTVSCFVVSMPLALLVQ